MNLRRTMLVSRKLSRKFGLREERWVLVDDGGFVVYDIVSNELQNKLFVELFQRSFINKCPW